ncbi:MAG: helix-turn-helix transcriptional regulator [Proteobacteria bacterium]|nr:helix-turn-helix transcriptional regulator [Pseudomonadota bacterium]
MNSKISTQKKIEFFEDDWGKTGLLKHEDGLETLWQRQDDLGKGFIREIEVRPGLKLLIRDFQPREHLVAKFEIEDSPLGFGFCLSGNVQNTISQGKTRKQRIVSKPGESYVSFFPKSLGTTKYPAAQPVLTVGIFVDRPILNVLLKGGAKNIPYDFKKIMDGSSDNSYNRIGSMTASMQMAVHQLLNCPYLGSLKQMYIESKAVEIITHLLAQLVFEEFNPHIDRPLRPNIMERICEARDIVGRNLQNPLSLLELARQVGINDCDLKRGFRQMFGITVFGYLCTKRMEQARRLLHEGKMNVTEVACEVGYLSLSQFARAFKKQFGAKPSAYLTEMKEKASSSSSIRF